MKFRYSGPVRITHLKTRKEGGEDEDKVLAVDIKLEAKMPAELILGRFFPEVQEAIFTDIGAVRQPMLGPLAFLHELENYQIDCDAAVLTSCRLRKFAVQPRDGRETTVTFVASFKPSADEVARLAEYLVDEIHARIEPEDGELEFGGGQ